MWKEKDIIHKNFNMNEGKRYFTFYDGPPTANGKPHVGHIETRVMKDIIPRYKVMKGYQSRRKAGWDTHGLPVELRNREKTWNIRKRTNRRIWCRKIRKAMQRKCIHICAYVGRNDKQSWILG